MLWNKKAKEWDVYLGENGEKDLNRFYQSDPILWEMAGPLKGKTVLDAGCGTGYIARQAALKGAHVIGIDASSEMIQIAQAISLQQKISLDFRVDDNSTLATIGDSSVDCVISNYVLMDVENLEESVQSYFRVLRSGGKAVLIFLHPCFPLMGYKGAE